MKASRTALPLQWVWAAEVAVKKMFTFLWVDFDFSVSENARLAFGGGICVWLNSYHFDDQDELMIVSVPDTNGEEISRDPDRGWMSSFSYLVP